MVKYFKRYKKFSCVAIILMFFPLTAFTGCEKKDQTEDSSSQKTSPSITTKETILP